MKKRYSERTKAFIELMLPMILVVGCIMAMILRNNQAVAMSPLKMEFCKEYSYDGKVWYPLNEDSDISALNGNIRLRGSIGRELKEKVRLNYFRNHIGVSAYVNGERIFMDAQTEVGILGIGLMDSMCGKQWGFFILPEMSADDELEVHLVNYHQHGNESAYREWLNTVCISGPNGEGLLEYMKSERQAMQLVGVAMIVVSCMLFGAVFVSGFAKKGMSKLVAEYGLLLLSAGGCFIFDSIAAFSFTDMVAANTYGCLLSVMLFVYFFDALVSEKLFGKMKKAARWIMTVSLAANCFFIILASMGYVFLFDMLPYWVMIQWIICPVFTIMCLISIKKESKKEKKLILISYVAVLLAIMVDLTGLTNNMYSLTPCTQVVFLVCFIVYVIKLLTVITQNYRAASWAKELESELAEKRIAIMLSQIKPHFIYNTLGTIEQYCKEDPEKAAGLVNEFSLYLRGNFTELDNTALIPLSKELEHVSHYVSIEKIRFPDIQIAYDLQADEFLLPPLSVQPLVENAIKHGIMRLESGGTVTIATYETPEAYHVSVRDDGVGFDVEASYDDKKHIGMKNIRGRIEAMCGGTLHVESIEGKGTVATISIPKEGI